MGAAHTSRICTTTGFALTAGPVGAFRIARASYGAMRPQERDELDDREHWGRFDTPGSTLYVAAERQTAFLEMLGQYRTAIGAERRALQKTATFLGRDLEELWEEVVREWDDNGTMKARWLPRAFREGRQIHLIDFPTGWWIDATSAETIAALHERFPSGWPTKHGTLDEVLTLGHLAGDDRVLTTAIATRLRDEVTLFDGSLPLGIEFISKHGRAGGGTGLCWAYWMRELDSGLPPAPTVRSSAAIEHDDDDLVAVQELLKIKTR